jgi:hypothetical protein
MEEMPPFGKLRAMRGAPLSKQQIALLALIAVAALLVVASAATAATRPPVPAPVSELAGPNFVVHYTTSGGSAADRLTPEGAATILANAETALSWYRSQGYPAPLDDGDGKTDIYVFAVPVGPAAGRDDESVDQTSGYILLTPAANNIYAVAHELFHVIQFGIFAHSGFFSESSAEWAGQTVYTSTGGSPPPNWFPDPWVSLDCLGDACGDAPGGYRGSIFWEYLSEHHGAGIVREAFEREAALGSADHQAHDVQALGETLAAHGVSLSSAFNGYAQAAVAGQITRPGVLPHSPQASQLFYAELPVNYVPQTFTVNHLAMRVIAFLGAAGGASPCTPGTLDLRVDLPPGVPSQPVFVTYPASGYPPATGIYPLSVSGTTATAEVPWATCQSTVGSLALPNASTTADEQPFTVHFGVSYPVPEHHELVPPRLSAKHVQRFGKLAIKVHAFEHMTVKAQVFIKLPRTRRALSSHARTAKLEAGQTKALRFKYPKANLKKIKAALAQGPLTARIRVTSHNVEREAVTQAVTVRLKR